ncbi:serine hydrolase domain-containing protein [Paenibacillus chitinolyticus]
MQNKQKQLQELFTAMSAKGIFNGVFLAADKGEIVFEGAYGLADRETGRALTVHSVFELASVSKTFTAMGILILAEQGKLSLTDSVEQWIPDFPYKGITVKDLLRHTSGLPDYTPLFIKDWDRSKIATNWDVLEYFNVRRPPLQFQPGENWEYTNTGYVLLALLIEKISGLSFAEYMSEALFKPLGMHSTRIHNRRLSGNVPPDFAFGYVYSFETHSYHLPDEQPATDFVVYLDGIQGDGTVNSTLHDLLLWDQALYTEKLVSKKTLDEAFTSGKLPDNKPYSYGYGWIIEEKEHLGKVVSHSGGWPGYSTNLARYTDHGKTAIYLSNTDRQLDIQQQIINEAENILFGLPHSVPDVPAELRSVKIDQTVYMLYRGVYKMDMGLDLSVTTGPEYDQLFIQLSGQPQYEILPLSEKRFFVRELQIEIEFAAKKSGKPADELTLYQYGEHRGVRVK